MEICKTACRVCFYSNSPPLLPQGRDVEFKVETLSRLVCVSLGTGQLAVLNCAGLWMAQQGAAGSAHCRALARALLTDCLTLLPDSEATLAYLPAKSPLLAANLLVTFGELFSAAAAAAPASSVSSPPPPDSTAAVGCGGDFTPPPIQVVRLAAAWLKDNPELCGGQGSTPHQAALPITGTGRYLLGADL
jgi:hypothetical protein